MKLILADQFIGFRKDIGEMLEHFRGIYVVRIVMGFDFNQKMLSLKFNLHYWFLAIKAFPENLSNFLLLQSFIVKYLLTKCSYFFIAGK